MITSIIKFATNNSNTLFSANYFIIALARVVPLFYNIVTRIIKFVINVVRKIIEIVARIGKVVSFLYDSKLQEVKQVEQIKRAQTKKKLHITKIQKVCVPIDQNHTQIPQTPQKRKCDRCGCELSKYQLGNLCGDCYVHETKTKIMNDFNERISGYEHANYGCHSIDTPDLVWCPDGSLRPRDATTPDKYLEDPVWLDWL